MTVGKTYRIAADDADLFVQVVAPGPSPLCIVRGDMQPYMSTEDDSMLVLQLIGWNPFGSSMTGHNAFSYFVADEQPEMANLIGMFYQAKVPTGLEIIIVACAPVITTVS